MPDKITGTARTIEIAVNSKELPLSDRDRDLLIAVENMGREIEETAKRMMRLAESMEPIANAMAAFMLAISPKGHEFQTPEDGIDECELCGQKKDLPLHKNPDDHQPDTIKALLLTND